MTEGMRRTIFVKRRTVLFIVLALIPLGLVSYYSAKYFRSDVVAEDDSPIESTTTAPTSCPDKPCPEKDCPVPAVPECPPVAAVPAPQSLLESCPEKYDNLFNSPIQYSDRVSQVTGSGFSGKPTRTFSGQRSFSSYKKSPASPAEPKQQSCKKWAVVTTIFEPSEAIRRQVLLEGWCLVIVADEKSVPEFDTSWHKGEGNDAVVYLTPEQQKAMDMPFVQGLPWNHFGRKNVGFVYAIQHGAEVIWDFDDDNMLKFWMRGAAPSGAPSLDSIVPGTDSCTDGHMDVLLPKGHNWPTYNPYPKLGAPFLPSWPRGVPLDDIKEAKAFNTSLQAVTIDCSSIAVLQSLADYQPDVDAIFRFTQPIPFWFKRSTETKHVIVPTGVLTPYNAQATLHLKPSFFALFLPVTVESRVSDIWRSYFAQRLFWDAGLNLGFVARPVVVQDRNGHSYTKDLAAESDLYLKSAELINFLGQWKDESATIVERTENLWIALYEREYVDEADVKLLQQWLQLLVDVGYEFPPVKSQQVTVPSLPVPANKTIFSGEISGKEAFDEEMVKSYCKSSPPLKVVAADRHTGVRMDIPSVMSTVGFTAIVINGKNVQNHHPQVFNSDKMKLYGKISPGLNEMDDRIYNTLVNQPKDYDILTEDIIKKNFEFYKNDPEISTADAFICGFPSSICEMWMPFNKTIIINPGHRYNMWRCTEASFDRLNEHIYKLASMNKLILGGASKYDLEYVRHYTGLTPLPLFNSCGMYTSGHPFAPSRDEILMVGGGGQNVAEIAKSMVAVTKKFKIAPLRTLYSHFTLDDLVKHRAVIFVPYAVMTYKLSELYSLNIPMVFPSIKFFRTVFKGFGADRVIHGGYYCAHNEEVGKPHPTSLHPYSPNKYAKDDQEAESYWLQFADYYYWPHISYFDTYDQLDEVLSGMNFDEISKKMVVENKRRLVNLQYSACKAAHHISKTREGSTFPKDYSAAIKALYGVDRLEVV